MEKYYKKNLFKILEQKSDIEFQIIQWYAQDELDEDEDDDNDSNESNQNENFSKKYVIRCFGTTNLGESISCKINNFKPYFYIKVGDTFTKETLAKFIEYLKNCYQLSKFKNGDSWLSLSNCLLKNECKLIKKKDLYGFQNNREYRFVKLVFSNLTALNKTKYIFKNPIIIPNINTEPIKYKLYESNFDPYMRFCHIHDILMAGWIKLPINKFKLLESEFVTTNLNIEIEYENIISLKDKKDISNFLQASWDIETYSYDGTFPDPNKRINGKGIEEIFPNVIYQIATTFKYYRESNVLIKHLLTLKKCEKIDDTTVIVEECKSEQILLKRWIDLINNMDPDILYTYNGDEFDYKYLLERCRLYRLEEYMLNNLSRVVNIPSVIKKEKFSSSAYGDSEFTRCYITGRLNYDLLIHYKRGMKKYSSYKLDNIANEILGEGKHDVSAKEIFSYYKEGKPEQIKHIGIYCIQDTELLQKLVDKQLILITIIQLANVTYVPIEFLTTRGQTIKVFSQLLRKARQMDYLVPHTNFNEDSYPILVRVKEEHELELEHLGDYIKINCGRNKNSYGKALEINGKISEIIDEKAFIVLSSVELPLEENFTAKYSYDKLNIRNQQIMNLSSSEDLIDDSFTGATVLTAVPGLYAENIGVLDFASLYPTIMISRNLCYSSFIINQKYIPKELPEKEGIYNINGINYERIIWDDKIEYKLKQTCEGIGKSGKNKDQVCGKQAYFDVSKKLELEHLKKEIENLEIELGCLEDKSDIKKMNTKIRTKEKELDKYQKSLNLFDEESLNTSRFFCRVHDPIKTSRLPEEKYQKKDVHYDYTIVQPHIDENGKKVNQGVLPALLEELYAERKKVKKEMAKANENGDELLENILDSVQRAIKVSLNSIYGFLGRGQGNLILKELGSIVTAVGRKLIQQSKDYAEGPFLDYIKEHNLLTQKIEYKEELLQEIQENEYDIILQQFALKK